MSLCRYTRKQIAYHEAGHAYAFAALLYRACPERIWIAYDEASRSYQGACSRSTVFHRCAVNDENRDWLRRNAAIEIVIAMAGPMAEFRLKCRGRCAAELFMFLNAADFLRPDCFDVDGDFDRLRRMMDYLKPSDPVAALRSLLRITSEVVGANWPAICGLAERIRDVGKLEKEELREWIGNHRANDFSRTDLLAHVGDANASITPAEELSAA